MKELNDKELLQIYGGVNISGTLIKSFTSAITIVLEIGKSLGTSIRRIANNSICAIN